MPRRRSQIFPSLLLGAGFLGACGGSDSSPATPDPALPPVLEVPFGIEELVPGTGDEVEDGWLVAIAYTGWLYDPDAPDHRGREFASATPEAPVSFRLGAAQLIPGIERGVTGMRVGGRRRLVVPPDLAFGAAGTELVPANATLLFEVEVVAGAAAPFSTEDLRVGEGAEVGPGQTLTVAYTGWLYDLTAPGNRGPVFDSADAEAPFTFTLGIGSVIAGWDLGVPGMRVGGLRRIVIPHQLAYGASGRPGIPGFATLLFEVELLFAE